MMNNRSNSLGLVVPFSWLLGLTLVVWAGLVALDAPLRNNAAPMGIVSLELAGTGNEVQRILESWSHQQKLYAAASLGLDYLFLVLYPLVVFLSCRFLAATRQTTASSIRLFVARIQLLAGPLDALENACLLMELFDTASSNLNRYASLARWFAVSKFVILAVGLFDITMGFSKQMCIVSRDELHDD